MNMQACTFIASSLNKFKFGFDAKDTKCIALKLQIAQFINDRYKEGVREFYSVCEQGIDLWAAEVVTYIMRSDPSVKLCCIIPYEEQAAKWHDDYRELYYRVLSEATDTIFIGTRYRKDCLAEARFVALDRCDCVFALVSGGETNEFVRYSKIRGKKVFLFGGN